MKKVIIVISIILSVVITSGCSNRCADRNKGISAVERVECDGHQYILFISYGEFPRGDISGIVHDPDCPCYNKEK